jgi:hypothetical protein
VDYHGLEALSFTPDSRVVFTKVFPVWVAASERKLVRRNVARRRAAGLADLQSMPEVGREVGRYVER